MTWNDWLIALWPAVAKLRAGMMPDLRTFTPMAEAGHA
jgi:hypothetical protein